MTTDDRGQHAPQGSSRIPTFEPLFQLDLFPLIYEDVREDFGDSGCDDGGKG